MTQNDSATVGTTTHPRAVPLLPEVWLAAPRAVQEIMCRLHAVDLTLASTWTMPAQKSAARTFPNAQRLAVIRIQGPLLKYGTFWTWLIGGVSSADLRRMIARAAADESIGAILLILDSPGGEVAGTDDLALAVRAAAREKPVTAYVEDLAASAAYYVASQATRVVMNVPGFVGSLGVLTVIADRSVEFSRAGIRVHAIASAALKTIGVPGVEVTEEGLEEMQRIVNGMARLFLQRVAEGRKLPHDRVRALFDGRMFGAQEALMKGLVDGVGTLDEVVADLIQQLPALNVRVTQPRAAATLNDLKTALPDADESFRLDAVRGGWSLERASREWQKELARRELIAVSDAQRREEYSRWKQRAFA